MVAILLLAALLRLVALGRDGLWADECHGAIRTTLPVGSMVAQLAAERQAPLYYVVQKAFVAPTMLSEWRMRVSSALLGLGTVALLWVVGRRIVSARAGLVAAFLLAVSPLHVHYSREARNYALLSLAAVLALWAVVRLAERTTVGRGAVLGLALLLLLYTHDIGAVYVAGLGLACLALVSWKPSPRAALVALATALAVVVAGYLPWLSVALSRSGAIGTEYDWLLPFWQQELPWQIGRSLAALSHGSLAPVRNHVRDLYWTVWPALGLSALLGALGVTRRASWRLPRAAAPLALAAGVPLVAIFVYSLAVSPVYVVGRVDSAALPPLLILLAAGIAALPARAAAGALVAFAGLAILPLQVELTVDLRSQERSIARHLAGSLGDGDVLVVACNYRSAQEYYLRFEKPGTPILSFPRERERHHFWVDWSVYEGGTLDREARVVGNQAREALVRAGGRHVWVLLEPDPRNEAVARELAGVMRSGPLVDLGYMGLRLACFGRGG